MKFKKCAGCGVPLQTEDPNKPGFVPSEKFNEKVVLCQRCFKLKHYGYATKASLTNEGVIKLISSLLEKVDVCVYLCDILNMEVDEDIVSLVKKAGKEFIVVVNKLDLLKRYKTSDLFYRVESLMSGYSNKVWIISAFSKADVKRFASYIAENYKGKKIMFIGNVNSGKSTLLNKIIGDEFLTTSRLPGTTYDCLEYETKYGFKVIDTPGLKVNIQWMKWLCPYCLMDMVARKRLTRRLFVLDRWQTVMFGGLGWITFLGSQLKKKGGIVSFIPDTIKLHRTNKKRVGDLIKVHIGGMLSPPCKPCFSKIKEAGYRRHVIFLKNGFDVVIPSVGWFTARGTDGEFEIFVPEGIKIDQRKALVDVSKKRRFKL